MSNWVSEGAHARPKTRADEALARRGESTLWNDNDAPAGKRAKRQRKRKKGKIRRFFRAVVWLAVLAVILDRVLWYESMIQSAKEISLVTRIDPNSRGIKPHVTIPISNVFVNQVATGKITKASVTVHGVCLLEGPRLDSLHVTTWGVHIKRGDLRNLRLSAASADHLAGTALITYADLNSYLKTQPNAAEVDFSGQDLRVSSNAKNLDPTLRLAIPAEIASVDGGFTITPGTFAATGLGKGTVPDALNKPIKIAIADENLPENIRVTSATAGANGIQLYLDGTRVHLPIEAKGKGHDAPPTCVESPAK